MLWGYGAIWHACHRSAEADSDWVQAIAYAEPREQATARHARAWKVRLLIHACFMQKAKHQNNLCSKPVPLAEGLMVNAIVRPLNHA